MAILLSRKQHRWNRCAAVEADLATYSHCTKSAARSRNWRDPQRSWCHQTSGKAYHHHPTVQMMGIFTGNLQICYKPVQIETTQTSQENQSPFSGQRRRSYFNLMWIAVFEGFGTCIRTAKGMRGYFRTPKWPNDDGLDAELPGRPLEGHQIMTHATQQAPSAWGEIHNSLG